MTKFQKLLNDEGQDALKWEDGFLSLAKLLNKISPVTEDVIPATLEATSSGSIPIFWKALQRTLWKKLPMKSR